MKVTAVQAKSGRKYQVSEWPVIKGEDYFVAQLEGTPNTWIAYIRTVSNGKRKLFRALAASPAARDMMLSDFSVAP